MNQFWNAQLTKSPSPNGETGPISGAAAGQASPMGPVYVLVAASTAVSIVATLVSGVLLARLLSVEDRGIVALVLYWAGFAAAFGSFSLPDAFIVRNRSVDAEPREMLPSLLFTVTIVAAFVAVIGGASVAFFPGRFTGVEIGFAAAVVALFVLVNFYNRALIAVERTSLNFGRLAVERTLLPIVYSIALFAAAFTDFLSVEAVLVIFIASRTPILVVRIWKFRRSLFGKIDGVQARGLFVDGARFHSIELLKTIAVQADKVVVSIQWSASNIAYFAVGYSAVGATYSLVSQALNIISLPVASKLPADEIADHFARSLRITSMLLFSAMVPLALAAPTLIPLVFGADYSGAVIVTQVLALALLPSPLIAQTDAVLRARGMVGAALRMHILTLAVLAAGWLLTGFTDIISLGGALAAARIIALGFTLATLRGDLGSVRLADCVIWRLSDFRLIWQTMTSILMRLAKRAA